MVKRHLFMVLALSFLMVSVAQAQTGRSFLFGIKVGWNVANVEGDDSPQWGTRNALSAGVFSEFALTGGLSLQPELLYSQKGATLTGRSDLVTLRINLLMNYIEIPLLLKYTWPSTGVKPYVAFGPVMSLVASSKTKISASMGADQESITVDNRNEKSTDFGFAGVVGLSTAVGSKRLLFELRYTMAQSSMWEDITDPNVLNDFSEFPYTDENGKAMDLKNSVLGITMGIVF